MLDGFAATHEIQRFSVVTVALRVPCPRIGCDLQKVAASMDDVPEIPIQGITLTYS
jgi:hypothetical protein